MNRMPEMCGCKTELGARVVNNFGAGSGVDKKDFYYAAVLIRRNTYTGLARPSVRPFVCLSAA